MQIKEQKRNRNAPDKKIRKDWESCNSSRAFDALEVDEINHIICIAKRQTLLAYTSEMECINFKPSVQCLEFLGRVGERLKSLISGVEAIALTYVPESEEKRVYEPIL